jgi:hypothetical protein
MITIALLVPTAGVLPAFLVGGLAVQVQADLGFGEAGIGAGMVLLGRRRLDAAARAAALGARGSGLA